MKHKVREIFVIFFITFWFSPAWSAPILYDWAFNVDGVLYTAPDIYSPPDTAQLPEYFDYSGFDWDTGLGTISITYDPGAAGEYYFLSFFDHEIDETFGWFDNEYGESFGMLDAGLTWEIDEPGYLFGDIRTYSDENDEVHAGNFECGNLDEENSVGSSFPDDVSMGLGWEFSLTQGEMAVINLFLEEQVPSDFYLSHTDADNLYTFYFSSTLEIYDENYPVPEPSTMMLMGVGIIFITGLRKRRVR